MVLKNKKLISCSRCDKTPEEGASLKKCGVHMFICSACIAGKGEKVYERI